MEEQLFDLLKETVLDAQKKMLTLLTKHFDKEKSALAQTVFEKYIVTIKTKEEQDEEKKKIYIPIEDIKKALEKEDREKLMAMIIGQYVHAFRKEHASYGGALEEVLAVIFAEMCINYSKIVEKIDEKAFFTMSAPRQYENEESQVKALLYILKQKRLDTRLIVEYIFGDQNIFEQKCEEVFGKEFKTIYHAITSLHSSHRDKENLEKECIGLLATYIKNNEVNLKDYWKDNKYIYIIYR